MILTHRNDRFISSTGEEIMTTPDEALAEQLLMQDASIGQARDDKIAALEADLERAKGLMREAADRLLGHIAGPHYAGQRCACGGAGAHAEYIDHKTDCLVSRLRAAAGEAK